MESISLRLKKILRLVVVLILLTISLSESTIAVVQPETPLLNGNLIWNIESVYYHIDVSANSYATPIADAAYNWANTGYGWNRLNPNTRTYNINENQYSIMCQLSYGRAVTTVRLVDHNAFNRKHP